MTIGVLGLGCIGRMHAELLTNRVAGITVAAVCDIDVDLARVVGHRLDATVAASAVDLFADDRIDAVAICTPTQTHATFVTSAARAGKAIFCEKPLTSTLAELDETIVAADLPHAFLQVGFNRRFDLSHRSVARAVAGGRIGDPQVVRISSRDPAPPPAEYLAASGGLFVDMTIHDFDLARYVTGSEVVEVFAVGSSRILGVEGLAGNIIDTAVVTLVHANRCLTTIDNSCSAAYGYDQRVEVCGATGMASSENVPAHGAVLRDARGACTPPPAEFFADRYADSYVAQWRAFADAYRRGAAPQVGLADARAAHVIADCAQRSLCEHRPISIG